MWYNEGEAERLPSHCVLRRFFASPAKAPPLISDPNPKTGEQMQKPRLIASDIDGTLIPYGESALPPDLFPLIRRLGRRGILFCPASGRQYHSLRRLFAPVANEICFLCENGAAVFGAGCGETFPLPLEIDALYLAGSADSIVSAFAVSSVLVIIAVVVLIIRNVMEYYAKKRG